MKSTHRTVFTGPELAFLNGHDIGRVATAGSTGVPHVVPVAYHRNAELDTIDVVWSGLADSPEFRHVRVDGVAAFVVDDIVPPWRPRVLQVRGPAEALHTPSGALLRIHPTWISSRGLDGTPLPQWRKESS
jgi:pyridoxamine 5'-phosphate oxidase family protein